MKPTPLERRLGRVYRGGVVALGIAICGSSLYIVGGWLLLQADVLQLPYPFLVISRDPVLLFFVAAMGSFITVAMLGLLPLVLLGQGPQEDILVVVLLSSIAIGFGVVSAYFAISLLVKIV